jgi:glycosyltransferase involved in cell wall biosynthesis
MSRHALKVTLCSALAQGGIAHYSYGLANALQAGGTDTTLLMYGHPEYDLEGFPHACRLIKDLELAVSRRTKLTSPFRNLQVMLKAAVQSDVIHYQWSLGKRTDRLHLPILRRLGKPLVYTAHDVLPHEPEIMSLEHCRWLYHFVDALFVHGDRLKALLVERFQVSPAKVHVIPHGNYNFISDTPGPWNRELARSSFGWDDSDRVVLFFGLIRGYKGIDTLIEACRLLQQRGLAQGQRLRLLIAGRIFNDHWREGGYEALIRNANLGEHVHLHFAHIEMKDIARYFQAADVVAVPYKRGSQSGVLRLAYSFGKPTVATIVGSLAEVPPQDLARFVAAEDPAAFADALAELLRDPDGARALGQRARHYADTELSWDRIAETTRAVYSSLLPASK